MNHKSNILSFNSSVSMVWWKTCYRESKRYNWEVRLNYDQIGMSEICKFALFYPKFEEIYLGSFPIRQVVLSVNLYQVNWRFWLMDLVQDYYLWL